MSKNHEARSMFHEADPVPQGSEVQEWRPGVASEQPETNNHNHEAGQSFGFYHPATTQRGGCYAE
jgi:hypothetical protein